MPTAPGFLIKKMSPQLLVADIERALDFYTTILGFDIDFRYQDFYVGIIKDGFSIHLKSGRPSPETRISKINSESLDIIFSVNDIEEIYEELLNKAIKVIEPLRRMPYGKEFYVADPDGHIIAFIEAA